MPTLDHVALAVRDPHRSLAFYRDTIGIEGDVRTEEYGFVIVTPGGVAFTLFTGEPATHTGEFHVGVSLADAETVHVYRDALRSAGVDELEWCEEPGYVSIKVRDPDGYIVEVAWDEKHPSG